MLTFLVNTLYLIFFLFTSSCFFLVAFVIKVLTFPFDKRLVILHRFACVWASFYIWTMPIWSVKVVGRDKIRHDATYVVVSNHQSIMDIILGYRLFFHFKWVAKAELLKVPFIGWNMLLNRYVFVKRGDRKGVLKMMKDAEAHLEQGSSVYIYPEGTRSETGELGNFKAGAFTLAKRAGVPVLIIGIRGSQAALPKGQLVIKGRHQMEVAVLEEVPAAIVAETSAKELAQMTKTRIQHYLDTHH